MASSVIYVGGHCMESNLDEYVDHIKCKVDICSRQTNMIVMRCFHIICESCLSKSIGENEDFEKVFVCPVCFPSLRKNSTWIKQERFYSFCISKKLCTQCFEEEAIHKNSCGHVFCKACLFKLEVRKRPMICEALACGKDLSRSDVLQSLRNANSILVWRHIKFPKYKSCNAINVNCPGKPILTIKSCNHSYCFACANGKLRSSNYADLIADDFLICNPITCKTIIPSAVLDNYLFTLKERFALTAITLELSHDVCYKCGKNEDAENPIRLRNRYCALHHAFCIKCIQEIQRNRHSEIRCKVMGTDIVESQMCCFIQDCSVKTPMACINIMIDVLLGKELIQMIDVFLRKPDIGEKCDTCRSSSAFVTRLVCSHTLCLQCTQSIALKEGNYNQCNTAILFCGNTIPTRVFKKVLESAPSTATKDIKQTVSSTEIPRVTLTQEIKKNKRTVVLHGRIRSTWPVDKPKWLKDDKELPISNISEKYKEKSSPDFSEMSLTIFDFSLEDEGQYMLLVGNDRKKNAFQTVHITMPVDLPNITLHKREEINECVTVFLTADIRCSGTVKTARWQNNGLDLHLDNNKYQETNALKTRTLKISALQRSDEGQYRLIAESAYGETCSEAVNVQLPGDIPRITLTDESVKGDNRQKCLKAVIESQLPILKYRWQKDGTDMLISALSSKYEEKRGHSSRELFILEPKKSDDGRYKFIARNAVGEGESTEIELDVMKDFSVLSVEMKLIENNTKLKIAGNISTLGSVLNIVWIKNNNVLDTQNFNKFYTGALLRSKNTFLVINDPNKEDEGDYKMQVSTVDGCFESQPVSFIIPKEKPKVTIEKKPEENVMVLKAKIVSTWPIQNIEWSRDDRKITADSDDYQLESSCRKNVFDILKIKDFSLRNVGCYKVFVTSAAGDNESEIQVSYSRSKTTSSTRLDYDASKYTESNTIASIENSASHSPDVSNIKKGIQSPIAMVHPPHDIGNECILCGKTAVAEMVKCNHLYCIECIQSLCGMSESPYINCIREKCPSYLTKESVKVLFDRPFTLQIQMPMHFGISIQGNCLGNLCIKKAVFTIMPCKHRFCTDCLQKCLENSECKFRYCKSKGIPSPQYFNNLFSSLANLANEKEHPFLLTRNDAEVAGYMTSNTWMCLTHNCNNQAEFVIIRCGHTFCFECGIQMENRSLEFAEFKSAKCFADKCKEVFPFPTFFQSNSGRRTSSEAEAASKQESSCSISTEDGNLSENKKNKGDNSQSWDKLQSSSEKRKEVSKARTDDKRFKPTPSRGLRNIGLSCYRNGILQILAETPEFLEILHDIIPFEDENWISSLYRVLQGIRNRCTMEEDAIDCLHAFHHYFNQSNKGFQEYQQDDSLSFLTSVLNGIEDAHSAVSNSKEQKRDVANPSDLFKGRLRDRYVCKKCKHIEFFNESNFFSLPLPVDSDKKEVTIGSSLVQLLKKEQVNLPCSKCDSYEVSKEMEIETFPRILVLQICKVEEVASSSKKMKFEKGYTKLRFWGDFKGLTNAELKRKNVASVLRSYRLYGVVVHWGSERGGHYICFVKRKEDQKWNRCDDSYVVDSNLNHVLGSDAYLLFYERFETPV